jgi:chromosomal replication initiation ATPase DnaA
VSRLDELRAMRDFIDREIQAEIERMGDLSRQAEALIYRACHLYGVEVEDVMGGRRTASVIRARHAAAWLLRRHGLSLPKIGGLLNCDHTTVLYACRKIDAAAPVRSLLVGLEAVPA